MSGPAPKRSDQRRRRNATAGEERMAAATPGEAIPADPPDAGEWSYGITQWYESLANSGQSAWYSATDWSSAWLMAETMNSELAEGPLKAATVANWLKLNAALLATEGDRRRAAVELRLPEPEQGPADVTDIQSWRQNLA